MIKGIGASEGIGIGTAAVVIESDIGEFSQNADNPDKEKQRYKEALSIFCAKTADMAEALKKNAGEKEAEILDGHIAMINDPFMTEEIESKISGGFSAEAALEKVCNAYIEMFSSLEDELTRQRAADIGDIKVRMLKILTGAEETDISNLPPETVLIVKDLTPSMTALLNKENISAIITETGGITSHCAILARALEIPAVLSVENVTEVIKDGDAVIADGKSGDVIIAPDKETSDSYKQKQVEFLNEKKELDNYRGKESVTADGHKVEIFANIGKPEDADRVVACDGEGVGLFRTEFLFMNGNKLPTEEEQFKAYKQAAVKLNGRSLIIRTLDIGGDKELPYLNIDKEENPFLGFRAVRYCLKNKDTYVSQLRAILRASVFGDIKIMIPLVTCVEEVRDVKALIEEVKKNLDSENISYNKDIQVGIMAETPSAAFIADILAEEADFFSIGTNDLTQYIMAADRGNDKVAYLYSYFQPAVIRSLKYIIECAKNKGIMVGMCGEAAREPMLIPLLLAFGLDEFSVDASAVLKTRKVISKWSISEAKETAEKALQFKTAEEVISYLKQCER